MLKRVGTALSTMALAGLVFAPCTAAAAEAPTAPEKSETVNVTADASGSVEEVEVETTLKNESSAAELLDATDLEDIDGKDDASYREAGGGIIWEAGGDDVTYIGSTSQELPIVVKVTYRLDGDELSPEDIAGKSGDVSIRYDFENTSLLNTVVSGASDEMRIPFTCITALMLDGDVFSDIKVENGKVIDDGSDVIVAGYAMPGLKQSLGSLAENSSIPDYFEVTAKAQDFELKSGMTIVTAGLMADMDVDELGFDDLNDVSSGLSDGMSQLISGADELTSGMNELADATDELSGGVEELSEYANTLSSGLYLLAYGLDGTSGLKEAASGAAELDEGIADVGEALDALADEKAGLPAAAEGLSAIAKGYDPTAIAVLKSNIAESDLSEEDQLAIEGILDSTLQVAAVSGQLSQGSAGLSELASQYAELSAGSQALADGVDEAVTALDSLYLLSAGLASGTEELSDGVELLSEGMQGAADGSDELARGLETYDSEGVSKIVSTIDDDIGNLKKRLRELSEAAESYDNFAGKVEGTSSSVKFVYETAAIEAK